jgi:hypothetical protein
VRSLDRGEFLLPRAQTYFVRRRTAKVMRNATSTQRFRASLRIFDKGVALVWSARTLGRTMATAFLGLRRVSLPCPSSGGAEAAPIARGGLMKASILLSVRNTVSAQSPHIGHPCQQSRPGHAWVLRSTVMEASFPLGPIRVGGALQQGGQRSAAPAIFAPSSGASSVHLR